MSPDMVIDITRQALKVAVLLCGPVLLFGLVVGVITNVLQAITQISETTLQVIPKFTAMLVALVLFSPWMIDVLSDFTVQLFESIPNIIR